MQEFSVSGIPSELGEDTQIPPRGIVAGVTFGGENGKTNDIDCHQTDDKNGLTACQCVYSPPISNIGGLLYIAGVRNENYKSVILLTEL
jgi:hypothetical protein